MDAGGVSESHPTKVRSSRNNPQSFPHLDTIRILAILPLPRNAPARLEGACSLMPSPPGVGIVLRMDECLVGRKPRGSG